MKINLLPPAPPLVRIRVWLVTLVSAVLLLSCALLGASWYTILQEIGAQRFALSEEQLSLRALSSRWSAAQQSLGQLALARQAQMLKAAQSRPSRGLQALFAAMPQGAQVSNVSYAKGSLTGVIAAPTLTVAAQTVSRLQASGAFAGVAVHSVSLSGVAGSAPVQIAFAATLPSGALPAGGY